jgi:hypothetical protein
MIQGAPSQWLLGRQHTMADHTPDRLTARAAAVIGTRSSGVLLASAAGPLA